MRKALAIIALLAVIVLVWPGTDCGDLTETECERAELIDAGAID
jgi:hypothetical protein